MAGKTLEEFTTKRANQCVLKTAKRTSPSSDKIRNDDPALLFQRITTIARRTQNEEADYFKFEKCSQPLALFYKDCMLRPSDKHELAKAIWVLSNYDQFKVDENCNMWNSTIVIDGGDLLHRIP